MYQTPSQEKQTNTPLLTVVCAMVLWSQKRKERDIIHTPIDTLYSIYIQREKTNKIYFKSENKA